MARPGMSLPKQKLQSCLDLVSLQMDSASLLLIVTGVVLSAPPAGVTTLLEEIKIKSSCDISF